MDKTYLVTGVIVFAASVVSWVFRAMRWHRRRQRALSPEAILRPKRETPKKMRIGPLASWIVFVSLGVTLFLLMQRPPGATVSPAMQKVQMVSGWVASLSGAAIWVAGGFLVLMALLALAAPFVQDPAVRRARKLARQGRKDEAIELVRQRIAEKGESYERLHQLGYFLLDDLRYADALEHFDRAEARAGGKARASLLNNSATALMKLGRRDEALAKAKLACERDPRHFESACTHAELLGELGDAAGAHDELDRAEAMLEKLPLVPKVWRQRVDEVRQKLPTAHGFQVVVSPPAEHAPPPPV